MSIIIQDLWHVYNDRTPLRVTALQEINLEIKDGEFLGIIGRTGSGKSTLVQHLNALLMPTKGTILIDGVDITDKKTNRKKIRQKVGLVFQYPEYQLFEETIFEDIAFGPRNVGCSGDEVMTRVREAMEIVNLDFGKFGSRSPFELSGGQMRRVSIAGILAMHPNVLVLDEPTAGLDPKGRSDILSQIKKMHNDLGITVILVSHSMEEIAQVVEKVIVMDQGKIVLRGNVREVFEQASTLKSLGLGIPQVTELMHQLKSRGQDVATGVLTVEEARETILSLKRGKSDV